MTTRQERRQTILELVARNQISSQEQLQELLLVEGINATQATISRDLRDLGIVKRGHKTSSAYIVVDAPDLSRGELKELRRAMQSEVLETERAGSLLVLKTEFGLARALALKIERAGLPHVVGTIASDTTIFIATRSSGQAGELKRLLERHAK